MKKIWKVVIASIILFSSSVNIYATQEEVSLSVFTDSVFKTKVSAYDDDNNGSLSASEIASISSLKFYEDGDEFLTNLDGIEYLTSLKTLCCENTNLAGSLDLTSNINLQNLKCYNTNLTSINASGLENLSLFWVSSDTLVEVLPPDGYTVQDGIVYDDYGGAVCVFNQSGSTLYYAGNETQFNYFSVVGETSFDTISFGDATYITAGALYNATDVTTLIFEGTSRMYACDYLGVYDVLHETIYYGETSLEEIYFKGDAPLFFYEYLQDDGGGICREEDLDDSYAYFGDLEITVYYPADNETWTDTKMSFFGDNVTFVEWDPNEVNADVSSDSNASLDITQDQANSLFSDEELSSGKELNVVLSVSEKTTDDITNDELSAIETVTATIDGTITVVTVFDIDLLKYVGDDVSNLTELSSAITITIDIPENLVDANKEYVIVRIHEGVATILEDLDTDPNTITFETGYFSTYLLAEVESTVEEEDSTINVPDTGDMSNVVLYIMLSMTTVVAFTCDSWMKRRYKIVN